MSHATPVSREVTRLIEELLRHGTLRRVREGLGGSHTVVTYPALDALQSTPNGFNVDIIPLSSSVNVYAHVAFCEFICPFCHYSKTYSGIGTDTERVLAYIAALSAEIALRRGQLAGSRVDSIYIGGGTPTSLSVHLLEHLVATLLTMCNGSAPPHFCVETSPLTVASAEGKDKLSLLRSMGVNRFSVGIQTFDDATLRKFRGHDEATALATMEYLQSTGAEINIDLIQDMPFQSWSKLEHDLECIGRFRPEQVTWYILRVHDEATWHKAFRRGDLEGIPGDVESAVRRIFIRRAMSSLGYTAQAGGRFLLSDKSHDVYKEVRGAADKVLLGFGVSAYSHGWGYFFRNVTARSGKSGIAEYIRRINNGGSPIDSACELDAEELLASRFVAAVRDGIDSSLLLGPGNVTDSARQVVSTLSAEGALQRRDDGTYVLSELGSAFEEEIASLFYSSPVRERLRAQGQYWASDIHPDRKKNLTSGVV